MAKKKTKKETPVDDIKESTIEGATLIEEPIDKSQEELCSYVVQLWDKADQWFDSNKRPEFDYCEDAAISHLPDQANWVTISTIFDPSTEKALRALQAKTLVTVFQNGLDFFDLKGAGADDGEKAKQTKALMQTVFRKMPNFVMNFACFDRQRKLYGTAVGKMLWDQKVTRVKGRDYDETGKASIVEKDMVVYKGPMFIPIDLKEEFRIDPSATQLDGFYKFHRSWNPLASLQASADAMGYKNLDKISQSVSYKWTGRQRYIHLEDRPPMPEDLIEILEFWSADDSRVITIANRSQIIKDESNPFFHGKHPFVSSVFEKIDFKFYGRGIPMKVRPQQEWLNYMINLHNESALRFVCGQYQVPEDFQPDRIPFVPGGCVKSDGVIKPMQPGLTPTDSMNLIKELKIEIEETSGANRMAAAMGSIQQQGSATQYVGTKAVLNEAHLADVIQLEETAIINIVKMTYQLLLQCMDEPMWLYMTDKEKPFMISPEQIAIDVDFMPKLGKQIMSKTEVVQNLTMFLQTVGPVAMQMGIPMAEMFKALAKALGIDQDIDLSKMGQPQAPQQTGTEGQPPAEGQQALPSGQTTPVGPIDPNKLLGSF